MCPLHHFYLFMSDIRRWYSDILKLPRSVCRTGKSKCRTMDYCKLFLLLLNAQRILIKLCSLFLRTCPLLCVRTHVLTDGNHRRYVKSIIVLSLNTHFFEFWVDVPAAKQQIIMCLTQLLQASHSPRSIEDAEPSTPIPFVSLFCSLR